MIIEPNASSPTRLTHVTGTSSRASPIATFDSAPPKPTGAAVPLRSRRPEGTVSSAIVSPRVTTPPAVIGAGASGGSGVVGLT